MRPTGGGTAPPFGLPVFRRAVRSQTIAGSGAPESAWLRIVTSQRIPRNSFGVPVAEMTWRRRARSGRAPPEPFRCPRRPRRCSVDVTNLDRCSW